MSVTWTDDGLASVWSATTLLFFVIGDDGNTVYYETTGDGLTSGGSRPTLTGAGPISDGTGVWRLVPAWLPNHVYDGSGVGFGSVEFVQPPTPTTHYYSAAGSDLGTSGASPPAFPTDGGSVVDGDVAPVDVGALLFDVYEVLPDGTTGFLATLDDAEGKSIRCELNGLGAGMFTLNRTSPNVTAAILAFGNFVKVRIPLIDPDPIFGFFLETGNFDLVSTDEEGGENLRFGGRGGLAYWDRAIWLSTSFTIPWWPDCIVTPASGAKGAVDVAKGTYRAYTVTAGVITGFVNFHTDGFCASFNGRKTYQWPSEKSKRFLVHIMDGDNAGIYFHPHQDGVTEYLASKATGIGSSVALSTVGDSPGAVLKYLWDESQSADRPIHPLPLMTVDFDDTNDSDGDPWATSGALPGLSAGLGDTYLTTLGQLLGTGVLEVEMGPDLDMHAWNSPHGVDRSATITFAHAVNIVDTVERTTQDAPVATFAEVQGTENVFAQVLLPDADDRIAREVSISGDSNDETTLEAIGQADLALRLARSDALTFKVAIDEFLPGASGTDNGDYWLGDTVGVTTGSGDMDVASPARVTAISLSEDEAANLDVVVDVRTGPLALAGSLPSSVPDSAATIVDPTVSGARISSATQTQLAGGGYTWGTLPVTYDDDGYVKTFAEYAVGPASGATGVASTALGFLLPYQGRYRINLWGTFHPASDPGDPTTNPKIYFLEYDPTGTLHNTFEVGMPTIYDGSDNVIASGGSLSVVVDVLPGYFYVPVSSIAGGGTADAFTDAVASIELILREFPPGD